MMAFTDEQIAALTADLSKNAVRTRKQAGRDLSYIEGWFTIAEANRIFGFDNWSRELVSIKSLGDPREVDGKWRVAYMATVRIRVTAGGKEIIRDGTGYGSGIDRDVGQAHESALKESETDAMKRGLMTFGNPFGLALYDKEQRHVSDERETPARQAVAYAPSAPPDPPLMPHAIKVPEWSDPEGEKIAWQQWATSMRDAIDRAPTIHELGQWMQRNEPALERLSAHSARAAQFLTDRADKRRHLLAQSPEGKAA